MESVNKFIDNSLTLPRFGVLVQYLGQSYMWIGLSVRLSVINAQYRINRGRCISEGDIVLDWYQWTSGHTLLNCLPCADLEGGQGGGILI